MDFDQIPDRVPFSTHEYSDTYQSSADNSDADHSGLEPIPEEPESAHTSEPEQLSESDNEQLNLNIWSPPEDEDDGAAAHSDLTSHDPGSEHTETANSSDSDPEQELSDSSSNATYQSAEMDNLMSDKPLIPQTADGTRKEPTANVESSAHLKRPRRWDIAPDLSQHSSSDELRVTLKKAPRRKTLQTARDMRRQYILEDELTQMIQ
ncbi:hypothetical protein GQ54DRAFT_295676 [Martensiomyces pterosporus]|nr:hypothetical protein GQ54DRAFT_295676 [Martensiomyces pterosporus]